MPKGTKVSNLKEAIMRDNPGMSVGRAIAIAQSRSHQSYATGKKLPPKGGKKS